jgi:uncharacterized protein
MLSLGYAYFHGEGVTRNRTTALVWYRRSARRGNQWAMVNLGLAYREDGTPQGARVATIWLRKAAALGNERARKLLADGQAGAAGK